MRPTHLHLAAAAAFVLGGAVAIFAASTLALAAGGVIISVGCLTMDATSRAVGAA